MKQIIEFPSNDGTTIPIEVEVMPSESAGVVRVRRGDAVARATETFEAALTKVTSIAAAVANIRRSLPDAPDELGFEFGLRITAEAKAVIAASSVEGNFLVKVVWKREAIKQES